GRPGPRCRSPWTCGPATTRSGSSPPATPDWRTSTAWTSRRPDRGPLTPAPAITPGPVSPADAPQRRSLAVLTEDPRHGHDHDARDVFQLPLERLRGLVVQEPARPGEVVARLAAAPPPVADDVLGEVDGDHIARGVARAGLDVVDDRTGDLAVGR